MSYKLVVPVLIALALGVNASPHPVLAARGASICSRIDPQGDVICGKEGYISDDSQKWPDATVQPNIESCAELCASTSGCSYFNWRNGNFCQIFAKSISDAGFYDATSMSFWYELGCFACQQAALSLDFEDQDVSAWSLTTATEGSHFLDILPRNAPSGGTTYTLRVGEITNDGYARADYSTPVLLEGGNSYSLHFVARTTAPVTNWDLVTVTIDGGRGDIYKSHPANGADLGGGWFYFQDTFMVDGGFSGSAYFSFSIDASGQQLDWFFDDFTVTSI
ncbi:hypothetical protein G7046_g1855 [Stylonectria norvegica]|nr:hypothetical protein G7046_g1855 [Stylonectria norvegica]